MRGAFREDCLSLCCLQASSAAAEQIVSDEGIPVFSTGMSDTGRVSLVTLPCTSKDKFAGANLNMRSMARRANYRDVICKVTRPSRAKQMPQTNKIIKKSV